MANKKQKRKAKLKAKNNQRVINNNLRDLLHIDKVKLVNTFPDKQERLSYIKALITDMDGTIVKTSV